MKNTRKILPIIISILLILPFVVACDNNCSHDNKVICDKCNEVVLGESYYTNLINSYSDTTNVVKIETEGNFYIALKEDKSKFIYEDENGFYQKLIAPNAYITFSVNLTKNFSSDINGSIYLNAKMKNSTNDTLVEYSLLFENFKIENNIVSYKRNEKILFPTLSEKEKLINESETIEENSYSLTESEGIISKILNFNSNAITPFINNIINAYDNNENTSFIKLLDDLFTVSKSGNNNEFTLTKLHSDIDILDKIGYENLTNEEKDFITEIGNFIKENAVIKFTADNLGNLLYTELNANINLSLNNPNALLEFILNNNLIDSENISTIKGNLNFKTTFVNID